MSRFNPPHPLRWASRRREMSRIGLRSLGRRLPPEAAGPSQGRALHGGPIVGRVSIESRAAIAEARCSDTARDSADTPEAWWRSITRQLGRAGRRRQCGPTTCCCILRGSAGQQEKAGALEGHVGRSSTRREADGPLDCPGTRKTPSRQLHRWGVSICGKLGRAPSTARRT